MVLSDQCSSDIRGARDRKAGVIDQIGHRPTRGSDLTPVLAAHNLGVSGRGSSGDGSRGEPENEPGYDRQDQPSRFNQLFEFLFEPARGAALHKFIAANPSRSDFGVAQFAARRRNGRLGNETIK
jgi:hypothetical protein